MVKTWMFDSDGNNVIDHYTIGDGYLRLKKETPEVKWFRWMLNAKKCKETPKYNNNC